MRKLLVLALILVAAVFFWRHRSDRPGGPWSTDSAAALQELEMGREAQMKLYRQEAQEHFSRALELDPDFAAARVMLLGYSSAAEQECLAEELRRVDLDRLSPREVFLVRYNLARYDKREEAAAAALDEYLAKHPRDAFVLSYRCARQSEPADQEDCYRKLIAIEPNFVIGQNILGYLAMAQGRFEEAEERFRTYQYIAPDQANPHDSMGELLMLLGRYGEAREEFERALALRADFSVSYLNLARVALLENRVAQAQAVLRRGEEHAVESDALQNIRCEILLYQLVTAGSWEAVWSATETCPSAGWTFAPMFPRHRAALLTGRLDEAARLEEQFSGLAKEDGERSAYGTRFSRAMQQHLQGVTASFEGRREDALAAFEAADAALAYGGYEPGSFKLRNRLALAQVLRRAGRVERAIELEEAVRLVNPDFLRLAGEMAPPAPAARRTAP